MLILSSFDTVVARVGPQWPTFFLDTNADYTYSLKVLAANHETSNKLCKEWKKLSFVRYELAYKLYCIINTIDVISFLEYNGQQDM